MWKDICYKYWKQTSWPGKDFFRGNRGVHFRTSVAFDLHSRHATRRNINSTFICRRFMYPIPTYGSRTNWKRLNEDFENLCDWFADNKLSIHFGEDKTILFFLQVKGEQRIKSVVLISFTLPDDGRSISRNVTYLTILVHDVINLLYYEYWRTDKQKYFYVY